MRGRLLFARGADEGDQPVRVGPARAFEAAAMLGVCGFVFVLPISTVRQVLTVVLNVATRIGIDISVRFLRNRPRVMWTVNCLIGLPVTLALSYLLPRGLQVAMFGYVMIVAVAVSAISTRAAIAIASAATTLALVRWQLGPGDAGVDITVIFVFVVSLFGMVGFVTSLMGGRLRAARQLRRVHDALRTVTLRPDLDATLESVAAAAREGTGAAFVAFLLRDGDHLALAVPRHDAQWSQERIARVTRRELKLTRDATPLARAFRDRELVVVGDVRDDARFPEWSRTMTQVLARFPQYHGLAVVPLVAGDQFVGIFESFFERDVVLDTDVVEVLRAYAEQATLVIVRAQAYEREREAHAQLLAADRMKSDFLALVSHELRTPLTAAKGFVDTVLYQWERLDETKLQELLTRASANTDELARLIDQLLEYSRLEATSVTPDIRPVQLHAAIDDLVGRLAPVLSDFRLIVDAPPDIAALTDHDVVDCVLENLLSNAAKFAPTGSTITVAAQRDGDEVLLSVADEGPGIALEEQDAIFERFYQLPAHRDRRGTGLGLTIARRAVETIGGRIWVESEPAMGSTFVCALPAAVADRREAAAGRFDSPIPGRNT